MTVISSVVGGRVALRVFRPERHGFFLRRGLPVLVGPRVRRTFWRPAGKSSPTQILSHVATVFYSCVLEPFLDRDLRGNKYYANVQNLASFKARPRSS